MMRPFVPRGVIPANLLPFTPDYEIDEAALRRHVRWLAGVEGVTAITHNGHAAEVSSLTRDERRRSLAVVVDEVGDRLPVVAGIFTNSTTEAAQLARDAEAEGAAALLVFPPSLFALGANLRPEMVVAHCAAIAGAADLPLIAFQYPLATGQTYSAETLVRLTEEVPAVVAIKDWTGEPQRYEQHIRLLHNLPRPVAVLSTHSAWLFPSLVVGADGVLSGAGSVIADLQAALWNAMQRGDLAAARAAHDRMYPLTEAFYTPPWLDMHNRMKEALVLLGRLKRAVVRPPLLPISEVERERIRRALAEAGILPDEAGAAEG